MKRELTDHEMDVAVDVANDRFKARRGHWPGLADTDEFSRTYRVVADEIRSRGLTYLGEERHLHVVE